MDIKNFIRKMTPFLKGQKVKKHTEFIIMKIMKAVKPYMKENCSMGKDMDLENIHQRSLFVKEHGKTINLLGGGEKKGLMERSLKEGLIMEN